MDAPSTHTVGSFHSARSLARTLSYSRKMNDPRISRSLVDQLPTTTANRFWQFLFTLFLAEPSPFPIRRPFGQTGSWQRTSVMMSMRFYVCGYEIGAEPAGIVMHGSRSGSRRGRAACDGRHGVLRRSSTTRA